MRYLIIALIALFSCKTQKIAQPPGASFIITGSPCGPSTSFPLYGSSIVTDTVSRLFYFKDKGHPPAKDMGPMIWTTADTPKCEHVFTQLEQPVIKIEEPYGSVILPVYHWPSGIHEGKDIVCVKCFHVQKQKIDYGPPPSPPNCDSVMAILRDGFFSRKAMPADSVKLTATKLPWPFVTAEVRGDWNISNNARLFIDSGRMIIDTSKCSLK